MYDLSSKFSKLNNSCTNNFMLSKASCIALKREPQNTHSRWVIFRLSCQADAVLSSYRIQMY